MSPPIIEGREADPKTCTNCGEMRKSLRLCQNCGYHTGSFVAMNSTPPKDRRKNSALRFMFDMMFKAGVLNRSK